MRNVLTRARRHWRLRSTTALAAVGALVLTSGVAIWAGPATATQGEEHKVWVCHATSSDNNPYVAINVDEASVKYQGHLQHRTDPNKRWKSEGTWNGASHAKNAPKPDLIEGLDGFTGYPAFCDSTPRPETLEQPERDTAQSCAFGYGVREGVRYIEFEWIDGDETTSEAGRWEQEPVAEQEVVWGPWEYTPYSAAEYARLCEKTPPPPPPPPPPPADLEELAPAVTFTDADCDNLGAEDWDGTLEAFLDYETIGEVGPGESVTVEAMIEPAYADDYEFADGAQTEFTHTFADITIEDCVQGEETVVPTPDKPQPKPDREPTVKGVEVVAPPAAAPTSVAAGLAGDTGLATGQLFGQGLAGLGLVMLLAAGWQRVPRRVRGVHER